MEKLVYKDNGWYDKTGALIRPESCLVWGNSDMLDEQHVSFDRVCDLTETLKELADRSALLAPEVHTCIGLCIDGILPYLCNKQVKVTFGGHFKTGKSTVVNAALGRAILPVSDYPETGAICLLRSGEWDNAAVYNGHGPRRIDCTTFAIQQEITLLSEKGERRADVEQVEEVRITLGSAAIPPYAWWIDSPGMNDTAGMTERAFKAARQADILLWVLSSKQFLSEPEMEFVARDIAERGPAAVVFLLNVFLPQDTTEAWHYFLTQKAPVLLNKLWHHAPELGFTEAMPPMVMLLAGRAAGVEGCADFGGVELRHFLQSLDSVQHPRVQCTRLYRAAVDLHELGQQIEQKLEYEKAKVAEERRALKRKRQDAEHKKRAFEREVESAVDDFLSDWTKGARDCGVSLAGTVAPDSLLRDGSYSQDLIASLQAAAWEACNILQQRINDHVRSYEQVPLGDQQINELHTLVTSLAADVIVPLHPIEAGTVAKATAIGIGVLSRIDRAVGRWGESLSREAVHDAVKEGVEEAKANIHSAAEQAATAIREKQQAVRTFFRNYTSKEGVEEAKANIHSAAEQAATAVREKRQAVCEFILRHCAVRESELLDVQPDEIVVRQWESLLRSVRHLADQALESAQGDKRDSVSASQSMGEQAMALKDELEQARKLLMKQAGSAIDTLTTIATNLAMKETATDLKEVHDRLQADTFNLIVVGRLKNGKSTLSNALLGRLTHPVAELQNGQGPLPVDILPVAHTAALTRICYAEKPYVRVWKFNETYEEWSLARYLQESTLTDEEGLQVESFHDVREFELGLPAELCQLGVTLIDSPSINDIVQRTEITLGAVKRCDAALMVFRSDAFAAEEEIEFTSRVSDSGTPVFTVVNMMPGNQVGERFKEFAWKRLVTDLRGGPKYAGQDVQEFASQDIYFVNALKAQEGKLTGNAQLVEESGLALLEQQLARLITQGGK
jgi:tRNA U34 5-carboxymethylaminomethyl modifying GTPase MnmE/TrmE